MSCLCAASGAQAIDYSVFELGLPSDAVEASWNYANTAMGINNAGTVIGGYASTNPRGGNAVLQWLSGSQTATRLADVGRSNFVGGLNNSGASVGTSYGIPGRPGSETHSVLWQGGSALDLTATGKLPATSFASAIDDSGVVIGTQADGNVFRLAGSSITTIPALLNYQPHGINSAGEIVGVHSTGPVTRRAFRWTNGLPTELAPLPGEASSEAFSVNSSGVVVGMSYSSGFATLTPVVWLPGQVTPVALSIYAPTADGSTLRVAYAINDLGQVVGQNQALRPALLAPQLSLNWTGAASSDWTNGGNWDSPYGAPPGRWVDALVGGAGFEPVVSADAGLRSLRIGTAGLYGSLTVDAGATLTVLSGVTVERGRIAGAGRILAGDPATPGGITNLGLLDLQATGAGLVLDGTLVNQGSLSGSGTVDVALQNNGMLTVASGRQLVLTKAVVNTGSITVQPGTTLQLQDALFSTYDQTTASRGTVSVIGFGAKLVLQGGANLSFNRIGPALPAEVPLLWVGAFGSVVADGQVNVSGELRLDSGGQWGGSADIALQGVASKLQVASSGRLQAHSLTLDGGTYNIDGTVDTYGGNVDFKSGSITGNGTINAGVMQADGRYDGSFTVGSGAFLQIGHSPGHFTVNGNMVVGANAEVDLEVQRLADGSLAWDTLTATHLSFAQGATVRFIVGPGVAGSSAQTLSFFHCDTGCDFASGVNVVVEGASGASFTIGTGGISLLVPPAAAVPEPAAAGMLLAGLLGLGLARRRAVATAG